VVNIEGLDLRELTLVARHNQCRVEPCGLGVITYLYIWPALASRPRTDALTYRLLFLLVLLAHDRRRIVHLAVTAHPTAAWTAQQLREACPWDATPRATSPETLGSVASELTFPVSW
jgi:hypothetical protein